MAATTGAPSLISDADETRVQILKEHYLCPHFRILVIGRANAGKTTILEKVCGVAKGTKSIIYDKDGNMLEQSVIHLMPSLERGLHDIEHQITYPGSNFIFHDSQGFEAGSTEELEIAWKFIERKSVETELKNQLHAIWYCIPMDSPRPILSAELEFFNKGTGKVPLVVIFTKFDGQINIEFANLTDAKNEDKWERAREIAQITFQKVYLPKVLDAKCPPKAYVQLEDMDLPEKNCAELTQQTADAIDDDSIHQLFVSTQMNNLDLCVKSALQHVLKHKHWTWDDVILIVFGKFPHFWVDRVEMANEKLSEAQWFEKGKKETDREIKYDDPPGGFGDFFLFDDLGGFFPLDKLFSMFNEEEERNFAVKPIHCQVLVSIIIIAKLSFWINKPFVPSVTEALDQYKQKSYVQKLKTDITPDIIHSDHQDLVTLLYRQVTHIDG